MQTKIMAIVNLTPDSFFDGGCYLDEEKAYKRVEQAASEGADWLDIGAESTRPFAPPVSEEEEKQRLLPLFTAYKNGFPLPVSIDTRKPSIARFACERGASLLNDVTGFSQKEMIAVALDFATEVCVMHMQNDPLTMQKAPSYPQGILEELLTFFTKRCQNLLDCGIKKEKIWIDPGIGFGKTVADNYQILQNLDRLSELGFPLLVGVSRKSLITKALGIQKEDALSATVALNTLLMTKNPGMIRVHDVKEHAQARKLVSIYEDMEHHHTRA